MKLKVSRFLSGIMAGLLLFVLCVPAFASDGSFGGDRDVAGGGRYGITDFFGFAGGRDYGGGGRFSSKEDYDDYVGTLPATGYTSAGGLIWQPTFSDVDMYFFGYHSSFHSFYSLPYNYNNYSFIADMANNLVSAYYPTDSFPTGMYFNLVAPISGIYCPVLSAPAFSFRAYGTNGQIVENVGDYTSSSDNKVSYYSYSKGSQFQSVKSYFTPGFSHWSGYVYFYFPVYEIMPDTPPSGDIYDITTRPTTITGGNYGIVGDDGQLTVVTVNDSIINETNNTYYNPATGNSETINNWTYDYSDRSYNITLESGDTVTVTYGDQYITVIEGGDTYIIYYVIDGGCTDPGDGDDDPVNSDSPSSSDKPSSGGSDEHSWVEVDRTEPTCTLPGRINYVCDHCGQTRVDVLPALGHVWSQKQFVPTTYDDEGNLIQQGYTIYECTVCGEQYKDETGTGPPGSSGGSFSSGDSIWSKLGELLGTLLGGIIGLIEAVIGKILDALIALGQMLMDKLAAVVEVVLSIFEEVPKLFGGFLDFLAAIFPFLSPEIMLLLTFGIAAVVFIGIIKAIRR